MDAAPHRTLSDSFTPVRELWLHHAPWDRRGDRRLYDGLLDEALTDPQTLICETTATTAHLTRTGALAWRTPHPDDRTGLLAWIGGTPGRFARILPETPTDDPTWAPWREATSGLEPDDAEALAVGVSLARWHALHPFCARCGGQTEPAAAGWLRRCPHCQAEHYPRTDPVVIMAVLDEDDRIVLSRGRHFVSRKGLSCPAGFVDSAESLEDAVRREVAEELGLQVTEVAYAGSQPWPAAGQLMVAMVARVADPTLNIDPVEVETARWFSRRELSEALSAGEVTVPPEFAAGRWLIEAWLGARIEPGCATVYSRAPY